MSLLVVKFENRNNSSFWNVQRINLEKVVTILTVDLSKSEEGEVKRSKKCKEVEYIFGNKNKIHKKYSSVKKLVMKQSI